MTLEEFLTQTQASVRADLAARTGPAGAAAPSTDVVFAEVVLNHMAEIGMCYEPQVCDVRLKVGNAVLRVSGYAVSDEGDQLDLFVSLYNGVDDIEPVADSETKAAAEQCLRFLARCAEGRLIASLKPEDDAHPLAVTIHDCYPSLNQIRVYVLTDRRAKSKQFKSREVSGKTVKLEVMDIERLYRHWAEGKPRDEIIVNFQEVCGDALPCVYVPGNGGDYDYALSVMPAEALYFVYEKFGARLLEANVRSFLSATGKVNRGIRDTLRNEPAKFMAFNNGIVVIADEAGLGETQDGGPGLVWLKGMQIVNGGQTTASLYFTRKRSPDTDLAAVRVPAKIIVLRSRDTPAEEQLISDISRYANSQNSVKTSDLSANKPYHVELERLALSVFCPDGVTRWFYERATGSYNVMLAREGTTPARLKQLKESIPASHKISKTDLAKYLNAWDGHPDVVSLGSQKNFERFMWSLSEADAPLPDPEYFRNLVAKAILFRAAHRLTRARFQQVQAQLAAYVVALIADRFGNTLSLDLIWQQQRISGPLEDLFSRWAEEAYALIRRSGGERLPSEWVKKGECWTAVRGAQFTEAGSGIRELSRAA